MFNQKTRKKQFSIHYFFAELGPNHQIFFAVVQHPHISEVSLCLLISFSPPCTTLESLTWQLVFSARKNALEHSYKIRKESLEARAERAILRVYVENQIILEHILLYHTSKYKHTQRLGYKTVCKLSYYLSLWLISGFFLSSVMIQTCQDQTSSKSSKKQISTISTQNGGSS